MTSALIVVDAQHDFVIGSLGAENRKAIIPNIVKWADKVDVVIASRDWHPADHCSFESMGGPWPRHCVQNSIGAALVPDVRQIADVIVNKGMNPLSEAYDVFEGYVSFGHLQIPVAKVCNFLGITKFIVCGYCTDYCVRATTLTLAAHGPLVTELAADAIAGVEPVASYEAVNEIVSKGVRLTSLD